MKAWGLVGRLLSPAFAVEAGACGTRREYPCRSWSPTPLLPRQKPDHVPPSQSPRFRALSLTGRGAMLPLLLRTEFRGIAGLIRSSPSLGAWEVRESGKHVRSAARSVRPATDTGYHTLARFSEAFLIPSTLRAVVTAIWHVGALWGGIPPSRTLSDRDVAMEPSGTISRRVRDGGIPSHSAAFNVPNYSNHKFVGAPTLPML